MLPMDRLVNRFNAQKRLMLLQMFFFSVCESNTDVQFCIIILTRDETDVVIFEVIVRSPKLVILIVT